MSRVLLVEDDRSLGKTLAERLTRVLGEMGEPETYKEHARAQLILSSVR